MADRGTALTPRFRVSEIDGYPIHSGDYRIRETPMLEVSVLDSAYCYRQVWSLREEDVIRHRAGTFKTKHERREEMRNRASGVAATLNAEYATDGESDDDGERAPCGESHEQPPVPGHGAL